MSWPNAILTDSGGFQVFSLSGLRKITEEGVVFRSHLDGDLHTFTPESTVDVQLAFGSDILMALDECPEYPVSQESARESMQRTLRWATGHRALPRPHGRDPARHALFPIVQGSMFADLRRECARELVVDLHGPSSQAHRLRCGHGPVGLRTRIVGLFAPGEDGRPRWLFSTWPPVLAFRLSRDRDRLGWAAARPE